MTTPQERAAIKSQLKVRYLLDGTYEVFTTVHGSGVFRWFKVNHVVAHWYCKTFGLQMRHQVKDIDTTNGGLHKEFMQD